MQVWTVGEGFGIGSEFRQTCCAANNFRDHEVLFSLVQVLQSRMEPGTILTRRFEQPPRFGRLGAPAESGNRSGEITSPRSPWQV